jgi:hypothetical protein
MTGGVAAVDEGNDGVFVQPRVMPDLYTPTHGPKRRIDVCPEVARRLPVGWNLDKDDLAYIDFLLHSR